MILPDNKTDSLLVYADWLEDNQQEELATEIREELSGVSVVLCGSDWCYEILSRSYQGFSVHAGNFVGVTKEDFVNSPGGIAAFRTPNFGYEARYDASFYARTDGVGGYQICDKVGWQ